jgi:hypothetical protein
LCDNTRKIEIDLALFYSLLFLNASSLKRETEERGEGETA